MVENFETVKKLFNERIKRSKFYLKTIDTIVFPRSSDIVQDQNAAYNCTIFLTRNPKDLVNQYFEKVQNFEDKNFKACVTENVNEIESQVVSFFEKYSPSDSKFEWYVITMDNYCKSLEDKLVEWVKTNCIPSTLTVLNSDSKDGSRKTIFTWGEISLKIKSYPTQFYPEICACLKPKSLRFTFTKWPCSWSITLLGFQLQELKLYCGPQLKAEDSWKDWEDSWK